jgi:hypothetical protein
MEWAHELKIEQATDHFAIELTARERTGPLADVPHDVREHECECGGNCCREDARDSGEESFPEIT